MYPPNSREVSFMTTAECREVFARLVRELDKLDEEGVFGPFGWRDRLAGPPSPAKSMSGDYRDELAMGLGDGVAGNTSAFEAEVTGSSPVLPATPLDTTVEMGLD